MNNIQGQLQLIDVYGVWYNPWWKSSFFYITILVILSSIVFYILWSYLRKEKKLTIFQQTLQDLSRLGSLNYVNEKNIRDSYFKMTSILKKYLIITYGLKLYDKNDIEILQELHGIIPENMIELLKEFFDRSFHIKFAYETVSSETLKQDIEILHNFIVELNIQQVDSLGKS